MKNLVTAAESRRHFILRSGALLGAAACAGPGPGAGGGKN